VRHPARGLRRATLVRMTVPEDTPRRAEPEATRLRREPPPWRHVEVRAQHRITPRLVRVRLGGPELAGFALDLPAASVRLLLPSPGDDLEIPTWNGNEFLLADGTRPILRTMTPLAIDADGPADGTNLDIEMVVHGHGPASAWASTAVPGRPAAVSGPGRGYAVDRRAATYVLAGDESALPAIRQLLPLLPDTTPASVLVEVGAASARVDLPERDNTTVTWLELPMGARPGNALVDAISATAVDPKTAVWAAGEAAAMQRIRRHLFEVVGLPRANATIRGYWKVGRDDVT